MLSKLAAKVSARKRSRAEIGRSDIDEGDSTAGSRSAGAIAEPDEDEPQKKRAAIESAAALTAVAAIGSALRSSVDLNAATRRGLIKQGALGQDGRGASATVDFAAAALQQAQLASSVLTPLRKYTALPKLAESVATPSSMVSRLSEVKAGVEALKQFGLHDRVCRNAAELIAEAPLFPVQSHGVPALMHAHRSRDPGVRTLCLVAPTGSGKTLAFALPIVQGLLGRTVPRLRALVILPTRDLAVQVHRVFRTLCKGTSLRVTAAVGQSDFAKERSLLAKSGGAESLAGVSVAAQLALGLIEGPIVTSEGGSSSS